MKAGLARATTRVVAFILFTGGALVAGCGGGSSSDDGSAADAVTLDSTTEAGSSTSFQARVLASTPSTMDTGFVLLHGRGGNPDSAVVRQLRNDLYGRGFTTLSIQEPVPAGGYVEGDNTNPPPFSAYETDIAGVNYVFPETYARVRAAINDLEARGITQVIMIGFSMGSRLASAHIARGQQNEIPIIGYIGIGMYATSTDPLNMGDTLDEISIPVLDIYGDDDTNAVNTAGTRVNAYNMGAGMSYTQVVLDCAVGLTTNDCHKLVGLKGTSTSPLETTVSNWVNALLGI